jgi:hypothetical protein
VGKYYNEFLSKNGFSLEVQRITEEYKSQGLDAASKCVSEVMLDSLTISGNSEQCIHAMQKFSSCGISLPIIQINPVGDPETSFREMLSAFSSA